VDPLSGALQGGGSALVRERLEALKSRGYRTRTGAIRRFRVGLKPHHEGIARPTRFKRRTQPWPFYPRAADCLGRQLLAACDLECVFVEIEVLGGGRDSGMADSMEAAPFLWYP
jgi:hypothetical protein